jgi:TfoX/Sxy family transcriptional regulator of competence genes
MPPTKPPKWRPVPEELVTLFNRSIDLLPQAQPKKMFGCPTAFINGQMFAGVQQEDFFARLPDEEGARLMNEAHAKWFEPMPGRPNRGYIVLPAAILADAPGLHDILVRAMEYTQTLPPKKKNSRKRGV